MDKLKGRGLAWRSAVAGVALSAWFAVLPAQAATVLLFVDEFLGPNYVAPALSALGETVTTASSWSDFNTKLASGPGVYQLAIALNQGHGLGADLPTMTTYVADGGRVIFTDWQETTSFGALFDATYTANDNQNSLDFTNPSLANGITNPQSIDNPGWGTYTMGMLPAAGGTSECLFPNTNSCAISGNAGKTLIIGFLADTPTPDGQTLWENLIKFTLQGSAAPRAGIPALSPLSLAVLATFLALIGFILLRRRA